MYKTATASYCHVHLNNKLSSHKKQTRYSKLSDNDESHDSKVSDNDELGLVPYLTFSNVIQQCLRMSLKRKLSEFHRVEALCFYLTANAIWKSWYTQTFPRDVFI